MQANGHASSGCRGFGVPHPDRARVNDSISCSIMQGIREGSDMSAYSLLDVPRVCLVIAEKAASNYLDMVEIRDPPVPVDPDLCTMTVQCQEW